MYLQMAGKELQKLRSADKQVLDLKARMQDMPNDMRLFSLAIRSLYAQSAVGSNSRTARKFRKLRDDTRNDAIVYLKGVLPLSTNFVASISEYFEYYDGLEFEEWSEMLSDILQATVGYRQMAEALVKMHEDILTPLKKRQDDADIVLSEFKDLQMVYEKKKREFEDRAATKRGWAIGLAFIPGVNLIACPLLKASADSDAVEAVAKGAESKIQEAASLVVSKTLIPALKSFIDGLHKAAGFFSIVENELKTFEGKAHKGLESPKTLHYTMMKKEAKEMKLICQAFFAVLPAVRTDFEAIPTEGTDQNYVDRWLEEQKRVIKEKVSLKRLASELLGTITGLAVSYTVHQRAITGPAGSSTVHQRALQN